MTEEPGRGTDLAAGGFSAWLEGMERALAGEQESDVPCGPCTACCASSQFVHIAPDETDALAHVPRELQFPAPRLPAGHVLLGYDERGRCPMLTDDGCSIYEHRPRTCRTYDCRVFPATGVEPDHDQALVAQQARRWRFDLSTEVDEQQHAAVRAAAESLGQGDGAMTATQLAVRAIEVHADLS
jgi:uncharacterized protein